MRERIRVGDRVKAFHPAKMGVVNEGDVTKVGSTYVWIDFGELGGGVFRVRHAHVLEFAAEVGA